jgi:membrane protease YdiL (CAAX protease family)
MATIAWSLLIAITFLVAQVIAVFIYYAATAFDRPRGQMEAALKDLQFDGLLLSICTFATLLFCAPLIIGIAKLKRGSRLRDYLALNLPTLRQVWQWTLVTIAFCFLIDAILQLLRQPPVPEYMLKVYVSTHPRWILWVALAVGAPLSEEICFRGFIFQGLAGSWLRWYGATLVTAILWAAIHLQYDWYGVSAIFAIGLLLGIVRARTNSTLLTMWLHSVINIIATAETAIALRGL